MVTITAPSSNPTPTYNRSGTTIDFVTGSLLSSSPMPITRVGGHTVVVSMQTTGDTFMQLPSDAEVGDVVEVFMFESFSGHNNVIQAPSSAVINGFLTQVDGSCRFMLLNSSNWGVTAGRKF